MPIPQAELNTPPATMSVEYNDEGIKILTLQNTVTILVFFSKKASAIFDVSDFDE